jgi:hypothetical protein
MDQDHLEVLANPHSLQRGEVPGVAQKEGFTLVGLRCEKRCLSQNPLDSSASDGLLAGALRVTDPRWVWAVVFLGNK